MNSPTHPLLSNIISFYLFFYISILTNILVPLQLLSSGGKVNALFINISITIVHCHINVAHFTIKNLSFYVLFVLTGVLVRQTRARSRIRQITECVLQEKKKNYYYYCSNFWEVCHQEEFVTLPASKLVELTSSDDLEVEKEEVVFQAIEHWYKHNPDARRSEFSKVCCRVCRHCMAFL